MEKLLEKHPELAPAFDLIRKLDADISAQEDLFQKKRERLELTISDPEDVYSAVQDAYDQMKQATMDMRRHRGALVK